MTHASPFARLDWLPSVPTDFATRCRALAEAGEGAGHGIRALASFALDENQLNRLAKAIAAARKSGGSLAPLTPFRLALLSNSTLDFVAPALVASAARHGLAVQCYRGSYGQAVQEALDPESAIYRDEPQAALIALDYRAFPLSVRLGDPAAERDAVEGALAQLRAIRDGVHRNSGAICIIQTLAPPPESLFGSFDAALHGTQRRIIERINLAIADSVHGTQDLVFDVAALAQTVGLAEWHSPLEWNLAKLPFSNTFLPLYAEHAARILGALRGRSRRCLVLDLDNTLWGGVIGDDGLEGIQIAQGDATGEAFLSVQRMALALRERGVVLAVCSKNNDDTARRPFREHPEMLLREQHIAVFQANWTDKATNLKSIAAALSLGTDALVFLDDNPAERGIVREMLPEVAVPELPADPAFYARTLAAAGYFESVAFSAEDSGRAEFYQGNAQRAALQSAAGDLEGYLASLKMEISFQPFDETGRARIAQLINKSNQFNLTTRRYTEADIARLEGDPDAFTLQVRLADVYGDNGMISVVICMASGDVWEIDTWLMSCRVLGRRVENMVLLEVLRNARARGIERLLGTYRPTGRNQLVEGHYGKLGFTLVAAQEDGTTEWSLDVATADVQQAPAVVHRSGFREIATAVGAA